MQQDVAEVSSEQQLQKAMGKIKTADHFRLFFLFIALFLVLYLFYGNKFAEEAVWFLKSKDPVYNILFFDVILMLISTLVKMVKTASYNKLVKKVKKQ